MKSETRKSWKTPDLMLYASMHDVEIICCTHTFGNFHSNLHGVRTCIWTLVWNVRFWKEWSNAFRLLKLRFNIYNCLINIKAVYNVHQSEVDVGMFTLNMFKKQTLFANLPRYVHTQDLRPVNKRGVTVTTL